MNRPIPRSPITVLHDRSEAGLTARWLIDRTTRRVGLLLVPTSRLGDVVERRWGLPDVASLPEPWDVMSAWQIESLVEVSVAGDDRPAGYAQGRTLRGGVASEGLQLVEQQHLGNETITTLADDRGLTAIHRLTLQHGCARVQVRLENRGTHTFGIELLSSINLMGLTPFCTDEGSGRLRLHRLRSSWSAEGRAVSESFEDLHLERSWQGHSVTCERFGQIGSMPTRGFVPLAGVEDVKAGVTWALRLHHPASWQIEAYRRGDCASLSAGLADREFGHWLKPLAPGEGLDAPVAWATAVAGSFTNACDRLRASQALPCGLTERGEESLPIIANEFCTTWGNPTQARVTALAQHLAGRGIRYLVIDAGWYCVSTKNWIHTHGDWQPGSDRFPDGLAPVGAAIRAAGLIPGIWFEIETVGRDSAAWSEPGLLQRDGVPITVGNRRFLDLADPTIFKRTYERMANVLRAGDFGYIKIDYNETIGIGCDDPASLGEGLRRRADGFARLLAQLRSDFPALVIESCSSGGHRLEPSLLALTDMSSFSDAHECCELPLIAANTLTWVPARQNQIWAVLRHDDTPERTAWSLAATFLGRMCLSGDLDRLTPAQDAQLDHAIALYEHCAPLLRDGAISRHGTLQTSLRRPHGWQAVTFATTTGCLVVAHGFTTTDQSGTQSLTIPLPAGPWLVNATFGEKFLLQNDQLCVVLADHTATVVHLTRPLINPGNP